MALGWSGSNGGVQEAYGKFVLIDVDTGISKYESFYKNIPESQIEVREFYKKAINGLKELKQKMTESLKGKL